MKKQVGSGGITVLLREEYRKLKEVTGTGGVLCIALILLWCFLTMYYADITVTCRFGLTFLDSLFDGKPFSFYANALSSGIAPEGAVYDIGIYVIFGIFGLPVWILEKLAGVSALSVGSLLWFKLLVLLFLLDCVHSVAKLGREIGLSERNATAAAVLALLSANMFFPTMVAAQYDVLPLCFMLRGMELWMKHDRRWLLLFAVSMTMKPMTALTLLLLVLLREKNVLRILLQMLEGCSLMLLCKLLSSVNPAYGQSSGLFLKQNLPQILGAGIQGGDGSISLFVLCTAAVWLAAYFHEGTGDDRAENRHMLLLGYCMWLSFALFGHMLPYWAVYIVPFAILTAFTCGKRTDGALLADMAGEAALTGVWVMQYSWVYGGDTTYSYLLLKNFCGKVLAGGDGVKVDGLLRRMHMEKLQPGVYAAAAACLLSTAAVAFLQQRRAGNAAGETQEEPDRWQIRGRLLLLFLWILLTLAALVLTNRGY